MSRFFDRRTSNAPILPIPKKVLSQNGKKIQGKTALWAAVIQAAVLSRRKKVFFVVFPLERSVCIKYNDKMLSNKSESIMRRILHRGHRRK